YWNVREQLGLRAAVPVFAGDMLKGALAALAGLLVSGGDTTALGSVSGARGVPGYMAVAAARAGHAWPGFAGVRGGRSILRVAGGIAVIWRAAFARAVAALAGAARALRSFAVGARLAVFGVPALQLLWAPVELVAARGALMCLIGLRFG